MKEDRHPEARFTTMVDLYALPSAFPGWSEARTKTRPAERVAVLERALETEFDEQEFGCSPAACTERCAGECPAKPFAPGSTRNQAHFKSDFRLRSRDKVERVAISRRRWSES
jgi:hypothetical protein